MENKEVQLNIPLGYDGFPINVTWREGQAEPVVILRKVILNTDINGPREYINKRYILPIENSAPTPADAIFSLQPGIVKWRNDFANRDIFVEFDEYPDHPINGAIVRGILKINEELTEWGLNSGTFMSPTSAIDFIRQRAHHFASVKEAQDLINLFRNFEVTFETVKAKNDDGRGNKNDALSDSIKFKTGELPQDLRIVLPLFDGTGSYTLNIEIELTRKGNDAALAFYCLGLETAIRDHGNIILSEQLEGLGDLFVIVADASKRK